MNVSKRSREEGLVLGVPLEIGNNKNHLMETTILKGINQ